VKKKNKDERKAKITGGGRGDCFVRKRDHYFLVMRNLVGLSVKGGKRRIQRRGGVPHQKNESFTRFEGTAGEKGANRGRAEEEMRILGGGGGIMMENGPHQERAVLHHQKVEFPLRI